MKKSFNPNEGGIRRSEKTTMTLPVGFKPRSYLVPEGTYPGTSLPPALYVNEGGEEGLRLRWALDSQSGDQPYEVARTYWPDDMNLLFNHLSEATGSRFHTLLDPDGNLDLSRLEGLRAEITVVHYHGKGHKQPFSHINAIKSLGTAAVVQAHGKDAKEELAELKQYGVI